jgi:OFA family oxalate/formate antiporter-like MFS transporter
VLGLGFGYASATPPAIKWFPSSKTGMIAGIVVAGFGLASVYIAPLANFLIALSASSTSMLIFGAGLPGRRLRCWPCCWSTRPKGYVPEEKQTAKKAAGIKGNPKTRTSPPSIMSKPGPFTNSGSCFSSVPAPG